MDGYTGYTESGASNCFNVPAESGAEPVGDCNFNADDIQSVPLLQLVHQLLR